MDAENDICSPTIVGNGDIPAGSTFRQIGFCTGFATGRDPKSARCCGRRDTGLHMLEKQRGLTGIGVEPDPRPLLLGLSRVDADFVPGRYDERVHLLLLPLFGTPRNRLTPA